MINLIPWRDIARKKAQYLFFAIQSVVLLLCVVLIITAHYMIRQAIAMQLDHIKHLQTQLSQVKSRVKQGVILHDQQRALTDKINQLYRPYQRSKNTLLFLSSIPGITPKSVYLTQILQKGDAITIKGMADNNAAILRLANRLAKTHCVQKVVLSQVKKDEKSQGYHFVLNGRSPDHLSQDNPLGDKHAG